MTWVRIDDAFCTHPKVAEAGSAAAFLFIAGLCYSNRLLTDGKIPKAQVPRLTDQKTGPLARKLVAVGLWEDKDDHYCVHDYLEYQVSRTKVEAERAAARARMKRNRSPDVRPDIDGTSDEVP